MNDPKIFQSPYICARKPIVVSMNQPMMIRRNPAKKATEPSLLDFFMKKPTVFLGPINSASPITKANYVCHDLRKTYVADCEETPVKEEQHSEPVKYEANYDQSEPDLCTRALS